VREGLDGKDLVISKLLKQNIEKYRSLFPHVSAAIQSRKHPLKGDTIQYIYTDSKHNNPLCRVTPVENILSLPQYDKQKYKEMIIDAAETVLGFLGFDRTAYSNIKKGRRKWRWYQELKEQRARDIETEMLWCLEKDLLYYAWSSSRLSNIRQQCIDKYLFSYKLP